MKFHNGFMKTIQEYGPVEPAIHQYLLSARWNHLLMCFRRLRLVWHTVRMSQFK